jgi:hypothetical protein
MERGQEQESFPVGLYPPKRISATPCPSVPGNQAATRDSHLLRTLVSYDAGAREILAKMTLDEKIGQMTQAEQDALHDVEDIEKYFLGSLLSGGSSDPKAGNSLEAWTDLYDGYQRHALKTRLAIPLLYGIDAVHGHNNVLGVVIFPHNIGLGCTRNPHLVESAARVTAEEVRATGIVLVKKKSFFHQRMFYLERI